MIATTDATVFLLGGRRLGPAHQEAKPHHQGLSRFCVLRELFQVDGKCFPRFLRTPFDFANRTAFHPASKSMAQYFGVASVKGSDWKELP